MLGSRAARAAAKLWYVKMLSDQQSVPVPRDSQVLLSGAEDPDRVLLIGNGPTHGWGTVTHELALTGQLSRAFTRRTGRPTDIRYVGDETMNLASVLPWLGARPLGGFDLVLLVLSMNDAVRLTPVEEYRDRMAQLLEKLAAETKTSARVVVAGIHPVASMPHYRGLVAKLGQRNADRLNAATREVIGRFDGVEFMDLAAPRPEPGRPFGSPGMYAEWSTQFVEPCATALDTARALDPRRVTVDDTDRDWDWAPGQRIIQDAPVDGYQDLDRLVNDAKKQLGVDIAYVSLVDGDRQYYAATTGPGGRSVPLELSYCRTTIEGDDTVVVQNGFKDDRFKTSPLIDLTQLRFYAGVPLKNEQGVNVGTFCVMSALPGSSRTIDEAGLEAFAAEAQHELQRLAADRAGDAAQHETGAATAAG